MKFALPPLVILLSAAAILAASSPAAPPVRLQAIEAAAAEPGYVYVPGGWFTSGTDDGDADDDARPSRRRFVPSFYIGRREVTRREWKQYRPDYRLHPGEEELPITGVTREEASAYCLWSGGRLPSDEEWEKAARGVDGRRYPWGDQLRDELVARRRKDARGCSRVSRSGELPGNASPYGALDMAGNAWEWVADDYQGDPSRQVIRGGAVGYGERALRTYHRGIEGAGVT